MPLAYGEVHGYRWTIEGPVNTGSALLTTIEDFRADSPDNLSGFFPICEKLLSS